MAKKTMKRLACNVLALASVFACAGTLSACETSNPEVKLILTFDGKDYELEYKLYRKITPTTVNHFLYLVENNYYDNLCVHNFDTEGKKMYTGGYKVDDGDTGIQYVNYYETIKTFKNFSDFPVSVWLKNNKTNPSYTLYGEFEKNNFRVENGALKENFGSLTMYYHAKDTEAYSYSEYLNADKAGELATRNYKYNSATSLFYISLAADETSNTGYCTFATLENADELTALQTAIGEYITEHYGDEATNSDFVESHSVTVDADDPVVLDGSLVSFKVPNSPITIKDIEIVKY